MVGHVMICRLSGLAVVILLPIRVPVAREASFRRRGLYGTGALRASGSAISHNAQYGTEKRLLATVFIVSVAE
jgi:hypothetical protein